MKKLMMAAAIVCAAVMAHAGSYNWNATAGWISPDDDVGWSGKSVYFFSADQIAKSALLANLTMDNIEANAMTLDSGYNYVTTGSDGNFSVTGEKNSFAAGGKDEYANLYALIVVGDKAYAMDASNDPYKISDAVVSGSEMAFTFGDTVTGATSDAGWTSIKTSPTPEPTSGLLLLIGMAGLALRRRRA